MLWKKTIYKEQKLRVFSIVISTQIIMAIVENLKNIWLRDFANNTLSALWSSVENFYTKIKDSLLLFFSSTRVKNRHT